MLKDSGEDQEDGDQSLVAVQSSNTGVKKRKRVESAGSVGYITDSETENGGTLPAKPSKVNSSTARRVPIPPPVNINSADQGKIPVAPRPLHPELDPQDARKYELSLGNQPFGVLYQENYPFTRKNTETMQRRLAKYNEGKSSKITLTKLDGVGYYFLAEDCPSGSQNLGDFYGEYRSSYVIMQCQNLHEEDGQKKHKRRVRNAEPKPN